MTAPERAHAHAALTVVGLGVDHRSADRTVTAVDDVSLVATRGELVVLAGPSGSGKSSVLRSVGLLDRPTRGTIRIGATDTGALGERARRRFRRAHLAIVHQRPISNLVEELTTAEHIDFARAVRGLRRADPRALLAVFGLAHRADAPPAQLSGGEQQRLAVAMAVAAEPILLVADEPTAELDRHHADEVIAALVEAAATGCAVVVASHDARLVKVGDIVIGLREGRMVTP